MKNGLPIKLSLLIRRLPVLALLVLLLAVGSLAVSAQTGGNYRLTWWTIDNGSQPVAAGRGYRLVGAVGQPEAAGSLAAGSSYQLMSGFWAGRRMVKLVHLPLILKDSVSAPDLVVESLVVGTGGPQVVIRNAGNVATADAFWVDLYFNPNPAPPPINRPWQNIAPYGANWGVTQILTPGETLTLTTGGPYYTSGSSVFPVGAQVYAYVDSINYGTAYGNVKESNENNNVFGPVISTADIANASASTAGLMMLEELPQR
jgi:hypothetical protein